MSATNLSNNCNIGECSNESLSAGTHVGCNDEASDLTNTNNINIKKKPLDYQAVSLSQADQDQEESCNPSQTQTKEIMENNVQYSPVAESTLEENKSNLSKDEAKKEKKKKGISFPKDTFILGYFDPPDPWKNG